MSDTEWILWDRYNHRIMGVGFKTKAEAQRRKVEITKGHRDPTTNLYRTAVVPATRELIDAHPDYYKAQRP